MTILLTIIAIPALFLAAVTLGRHLAAAFRVPDDPPPASWLAKQGGGGDERVV